MVHHRGRKVGSPFHCLFRLLQLLHHGRPVVPAVVSRVVSRRECRFHLMSRCWNHPAEVSADERKSSDLMVLLAFRHPLAPPEYLAVSDRMIRIDHPYPDYLHRFVPPYEHCSDWGRTHRCPIRGLHPRLGHLQSRYLDPDSNRIHCFRDRRHLHLPSVHTPSINMKSDGIVTALNRLYSRERDFSRVFGAHAPLPMLTLLLCLVQVPCTGLTQRAVC